MKRSTLVHVAELIDSAEKTKWAYQDIAAYWDKMPNSAHYGARMANWVPDFEFAHAVFLDTIALTLPANARILELGAGSGRISQMVLDRFPDCHVTLTDVSQNMLDGAHERLSGYEGRFETISADFFDPGALEFKQQEFDCIISFFAICHSRAVERVNSLYHQAFGWLKLGGLFLSHDHVLGGTAELTAHNAAIWHTFITSNGGTQAAADEAIVSTYQEDYPLTIAQHLSLLSNIGFSGVDVPYKRGLFGMVAGVK